MKKVKLGSSDLMVTEVCLGSMTWGIQNTVEQAFEQLDYAMECGINFIDTAEIYPVPPNKETQGDTERFIGKWLSKNSQKRKDIVLATKVGGAGIAWVRGGEPMNRNSILTAVDLSLDRLQTDYIDLYQLHWPNRSTPHFSKHWPGMVDVQSDQAKSIEENMLDLLGALDECIKAGKIKAVGLSNETPWGISEYIRLAKEHNLPRMASVQNEFNLLMQKDSSYVLENCIYNDLAYLPWSPLAGGALSGKYANGQKPAGARWTMVQRNGIFRDTTSSHEAIAAYKSVAEKYGMTVAQLALAWVYQVQGVTSTIIGATSMEQLKEDISAYELALSSEVLEEIGAVIKRFPAPF